MHCFVYEWYLHFWRAGPNECHPPSQLSTKRFPKQVPHRTCERNVSASPRTITINHNAYHTAHHMRLVIQPVKKITRADVQRPGRGLPPHQDPQRTYPRLALPHSHRASSRREQAERRRLVPHHPHPHPVHAVVRHVDWLRHGQEGLPCHHPRSVAGTVRCAGFETAAAIFSRQRCRLLTLVTFASTPARRPRPWRFGGSL